MPEVEFEKKFLGEGLEVKLARISSRYFQAFVFFTYIFFVILAFYRQHLDKATLRDLIFRTVQSTVNQLEVEQKMVFINAKLTSLFQDLGNSHGLDFGLQLQREQNETIAQYNFSKPENTTLLDLDFYSDSGHSYQLIVKLSAFSLYRWLLINILLATTILTFLFLLARRGLMNTNSFLLGPMAKMIDQIQNYSQQIDIYADNPIEFAPGESKEINQLGIAINKFQEKLKEIEDQKIMAKLKEDRFQLARSVAHDLQSPLAALKNVTSSTEAQGQLNLIPMVIERLDSMVKDLLNKSTLNYLDSIKLKQILEGLIAEKKLTHPQLPVSLEMTNVVEGRISCDENGLIRVLSNIINNSLDAYIANKKLGPIKIKVQTLNRQVHISITDKAGGIPASVFSELGQRPLHSEKMTGQGIGLFTANQRLKEWEGQMTINNDLNIGCEVCVSLRLV